MSLEEELNEIPEIESDLSTEIGYNNICSNGNDVEQITYSIIDNCAMLMINS
ncbi:MAG: hypothetical protein DHS20C13_28580 [Thermodesulfobacteriota bacterium]|nr:MAG: hypothetical protein DHS20C13_28580 [Thermodesulfobacteriota bacterium]